MKRQDRLEREKEYIEVNNSKESVCKGFFYIKNKKYEESCKHCKECGKYQAYKKDIDKQVQFHYVDSFRECELYKKFPLKKKDTRDFDAVWRKIQASNPMMCASSVGSIHVNKPRMKFVKVPMGDGEAKIHAYEKMVHDHSELMAYTTWTQLLSIEVMNRAYKMLNEVIRESSMYYGKIEETYRNLNYKFSKYIEQIHKKCYKGDEFVVMNFSKRYDKDIIKMRIAISNFLGRFKEVFLTDELALIITLQNIVELVDLRRVDSEKYIEKYNKNVKFDKFISTELLKEPINSLILEISNFMGIHSTIDLNTCDDMVIGMKVIDKKIGEYDTIKELLREVYIANNNKNRIKNKRR